MAETRKITIELTEENVSFFLNLLWLSYQKPVIKIANYIKRSSLDQNQAEFGNTASDIQNFIYENVGFAVTNEEDCKLTGKNLEEWKERKARQKVKIQ